MKPAQIFNIELWYEDKVICAAASCERVDEQTQSGRYILTIPDKYLKGHILPFKIRCVELDQILAEPQILCTANPCLSDFPFLATPECEQIDAVKYSDKNAVSRKALYEKERNFLNDQLTAIPPHDVQRKADIFIKLANLAITNGFLKDAEQCWQDAILSYPKNDLICAGYLDFLYCCGREKEAWEHLNSLEEHQKESGELKRISHILKETFAEPSFLSRIKHVNIDYSSARPTISAIVPNYNYARFLRQRLNSILMQTKWPDEIILLDDGSTDLSQQIITEFSAISPIPVQVDINHNNSSNIFTQWIKGIKMAQGDLIWIAEADDFCTSEFLEKLSIGFEDDHLQMAWCDSIPIDDFDQEAGDAYKDFYTKLDPHLDYTNNFKLSGIDVLNNGLLQYCCIPNSSAVLFRKSAIPDDFERIKEFSCCGDWWMWREIALRGEMSYNSLPMNRHRKRRWPSSRGVANGEMFSQHIKLHLDLYSKANDIFNWANILSLMKQLQKDYLTYRYESNADAYWCANSRRFGEQYMELMARLQNGSPIKEYYFPPKELLIMNENWRMKRTILESSALFDPKFYLDTYPDIRSAGIDPIEHYLTDGWREGRVPTPAGAKLAKELCWRLRTIQNPILFLEGWPDSGRFRDS